MYLYTDKLNMKLELVFNKFLYINISIYLQNNLLCLCQSNIYCNANKAQAFHHNFAILLTNTGNLHYYFSLKLKPKSRMS